MKYWISQRQDGSALRPADPGQEPQQISHTPCLHSWDRHLTQPALWQGAQATLLLQADSQPEISPFNSQASQDLSLAQIFCKTVPSRVNHPEV